jgi:DNA processing protein
MASGAAMAIARMPYLSARERIRLLGAVGTAPLASLRLGDVERIVGRSLHGAAWDPLSWAAEAERDASYLDGVGGSSFSYYDPGYPAILRETARPPFMLYVRGRLPDQGRPSVAIVGTRFPTGRGLDAAAALGMEAGAAGVWVVSGLARGIDSAAHRGALAVRGATFAVLGRGIDAVYPASNKELASRIVASGGGFASEYPPGTLPSRWTFPERNRILAGLCRSTVVVEAPGGSGALISAAFALEEGRDVYVVASCMGGIRSAGSDSLAADGAVTLSCFGDIIEDWRDGRGRSTLTLRRGARNRRSRRRLARSRRGASRCGHGPSAEQASRST